MTYYFRCSLVLSIDIKFDLTNYLPKMQKVFNDYVNFGKTAKQQGPPRIETRNVTKMMKECGVLDNKYTSNSLDNDVARVIGKLIKNNEPSYVKGIKTLNYKGFKALVEQIAESKKTDAANIMSKIESLEGPSLDNTTGVANKNNVDRMTDTANYTGMHKNRFNADGTGKGIEGREDVNDNKGYMKMNESTLSVRKYTTSYGKPLVNALNRESRLLPTIWPEWNEYDLANEKWLDGKIHAEHVAYIYPLVSKKLQLLNMKRRPYEDYFETEKQMESTGIFVDPEGNNMLPDNIEPTAWQFAELYIGETPCVNASVGQQGRSIDLITSNKSVVEMTPVYRIIISVLDHLWNAYRHLLISHKPKYHKLLSIDNGWHPWDVIYNPGEKRAPVRTSITSYGTIPLNSKGKYAVKLYFMGAWRKILVDTLVPLDEQGRSLLPESSIRNEIWPLILFKAILKILSISCHQRNFDYCRVEQLVFHTLTGWSIDKVKLKNTRNRLKFSTFLQNEAENLEVNAVIKKHQSSVTKVQQKLLVVASNVRDDDQHLQSFRTKLCSLVERGHSLLIKRCATPRDLLLKTCNDIHQSTPRWKMYRPTTFPNPIGLTEEWSHFLKSHQLMLQVTSPIIDLINNNQPIILNRYGITTIPIKDAIFYANISNQLLNVIQKYPPLLNRFTREKRLLTNSFVPDSLSGVFGKINQLDMFDWENLETQQFWYKHFSFQTFIQYQFINPKDNILSLEEEKIITESVLPNRMDKLVYQYFCKEQTEYYQNVIKKWHDNHLINERMRIELMKNSNELTQLISREFPEFSLIPRRIQTTDRSVESDLSSTTTTSSGSLLIFNQDYVTEMCQFCYPSFPSKLFQLLLIYSNCVTDKLLESLEGSEKEIRIVWNELWRELCAQHNPEFVTPFTEPDNEIRDSIINTEKIHIDRDRLVVEKIPESLCKRSANGISVKEDNIYSDKWMSIVDTLTFFDYVLTAKQMEQYNSTLELYTSKKLLSVLLPRGTERKFLDKYRLNYPHFLLPKTYCDGQNMMNQATVHQFYLVTDSNKENDVVIDISSLPRWYLAKKRTPSVLADSTTSKKQLVEPSIEWFIQNDEEHNENIITPILLKLLDTPEFMGAADMVPDTVEETEELIDYLPRKSSAFSSFNNSIALPKSIFLENESTIVIQSAFGTKGKYGQGILCPPRKHDYFQISCNSYDNIRFTLPKGRQIFNVELYVPIDCNLRIHAKHPVKIYDKVELSESLIKYDQQVVHLIHAIFHVIEKGSEKLNVAYGCSIDKLYRKLSTIVRHRITNLNFHKIQISMRKLKKVIIQKCLYSIITMVYDMRSSLVLTDENDPITLEELYHHRFYRTFFKYHEEFETYRFHKTKTIGMVSNEVRRKTHGFIKMNEVQLLQHCCYFLKLLNDSVHIKKEKKLRIFLKNLVEELTMKDVLHWHKMFINPFTVFNLDCHSLGYNYFSRVTGTQQTHTFNYSFVDTTKSRKGFENLLLLHQGTYRSPFSMEEYMEIANDFTYSNNASNDWWLYTRKILFEYSLKKITITPAVKVRKTIKPPSSPVEGEETKNVKEDLCWAITPMIFIVNNDNFQSTFKLGGDPLPYLFPPNNNGYTIVVCLRLSDEVLCDIRLNSYEIKWQLKIVSHIPIPLISEEHWGKIKYLESKFRFDEFNERIHKEIANSKATDLIDRPELPVTLYNVPQQNEKDPQTSTSAKKKESPPVEKMNKRDIEKKRARDSSKAKEMKVVRGSYADVDNIPVYKYDIKNVPHLSPYFLSKLLQYNLPSSEIKANFEEYVAVQVFNFSLNASTKLLTKQFLTVNKTFEATLILRTTNPEDLIELRVFNNGKLFIKQQGYGSVIIPVVHFYENYDPKTFQSQISSNKSRRSLTTAKSIRLSRAMGETKEVWRNKLMIDDRWNLLGDKIIINKYHIEAYILNKPFKNDILTEKELWYYSAGIKQLRLYPDTLKGSVKLKTRSKLENLYESLEERNVLTKWTIQYMVRKHYLKNFKVSYDHEGRRKKTTDSTRGISSFVKPKTMDADEAKAFAETFKRKFNSFRQRDKHHDMQKLFDVRRKLMNSKFRRLNYDQRFMNGSLTRYLMMEDTKRHLFSKYFTHNSNTVRKTFSKVSRRIN
ncbi:hypothetical protein SNEBB_003736 [Seison nebaliae]|nr:hypothetical protein SNEBB_003736 [Seison nebaliae]